MYLLCFLIIHTVSLHSHPCHQNRKTYSMNGVCARVISDFSLKTIYTLDFLKIMIDYFVVCTFCVTHHIIHVYNFDVVALCAFPVYTQLHAMLNHCYVNNIHNVLSRPLESTNTQWMFCRDNCLSTDHLHEYILYIA